MNSNFVSASASNCYAEPEENLFKTIFRQYERVIVESLLTSFGLDMIISKNFDQHGGDVDTIHNVRQIGTDNQMTYKNSANEAAYNNRGAYESDIYHAKNNNYRQTKHNARALAAENNGVITDEYTGKQVAFSKSAPSSSKASLDHVIAAKEIHEDRGRVLSGLNGSELANSDENLKFTNASLNSSMQAMSIPQYIESHPELDEKTKQNMMAKYERSKISYETKLATAYYTSPQFAKDTAIAAGKVSGMMGLRQALGFLFANIWFAVKDEIEKRRNCLEKDFDMKAFFHAIADGVKKGIQQTKAMDMVTKVIEGSVAGALSSLTTTLCNIFFTTAKNVVKIIRESYASVVEAVKVLFINPDGYMFGDRIKATVKIIATGASVVVGGMVSAAISGTPIGAIPVIGDIVQTFCGTLITGIMSCTLLMFIDRSEMVRKLVNSLNNLPTIEKELAYYKEQARFFEEYAAELMKIDIDKFRREVDIYSAASDELLSASTNAEVNRCLKEILKKLNIKTSWDSYDSFDSFMNDKKAIMVFK